MVPIYLACGNRDILTTTNLNIEYSILNVELLSCSYIRPGLQALLAIKMGQTNPPDLIEDVNIKDMIRDLNGYVRKIVEMRY